MPLPVTKGELNRLGDRLIATATPSDADLDDLKIVLGAYQDVLERVKADLRGLGFAPTGRVKTTKTMTDKLRRTHRMQLSRVQDLAGARIVVQNIAAQDEAKDKISEFYTARDCPYRPVDRRADPRFGYRAFHLIVMIDGMPVEIQIRTSCRTRGLRSSSGWQTAGAAASATGRIQTTPRASYAQVSWSFLAALL